jgi:hypothetical protein
MKLLVVRRTVIRFGVLQITCSRYSRGVTRSSAIVNIFVVLTGYLPAPRFAGHISLYPPTAFFNYPKFREKN